MTRRVATYGLLALATVATTTGFVAHRLLDRPGESAFQYVPENALGVASFDLVPAPDQVLAFKHIDETIAAANGGTVDTGSLLSSLVGDEKLKPLIQQADRSLAVAWLPAPGKADPGDGDAVAFVALKDAATFEDTLRKVGKPQIVDGTTVYSVTGKTMGSAFVMVHDGYAIVSDKAWPLAAVSSVIRGKTGPITAVPAFANARTRALSSSNLLVLVGPQFAKSDDWGVGSMAIRETGLEMAFSGQTNDPNVLKAGTLKPLSADLLGNLPRGAYGFLGMAQPGSAVALAGSALDDPQKSMPKDADLDLRKDVLPALAGDVAIGFYPSFGPDAGLDLLVSVDDANGADPTLLARKLEAMIGREIDKGAGPKGAWDVPLTVSGVEGSRLADEPTDEMAKELQGMERSYFRPLTLSKGKTVAWATVGGTVILATSQSLLARAVAARQNPAAGMSLASDLALGTNPAATVDGQFALAISMKRLAEGLRNTIDPSHMTSETAKAYRKSLAFYDATTEPFAIRARMDASGKYRAFVSMPFDWSKLPEAVK